VPLGLRIDSRRDHNAPSALADDASHVDQVRGRRNVRDLFTCQHTLDDAQIVIAKALDVGVLRSHALGTGRDQDNHPAVAHRKLRRVDALGGHP